MPANTSLGACELCGKSGRKAAMARHVVACAVEHDGGGPTEPLVHVRIEAVGAPQYWLHVETGAGASLQQLDALLRAEWLECCGHLSAFRVGRDEVSKRTSIAALARVRTFDYDYDYGSTTALRGKLLGMREGAAMRPAVRVLARNVPLNWPCAECEAPAVVVCPYCVYTEPSLFCADHGPSHPCDADDVWLPVVNSPRMGVCGYVGPRSKRSCSSAASATRPRADASRPRRDPRKAKVYPSQDG
jgi:hypothetical protein